MNKSLDFPPKEFKKILDKTSKLLQNQYANLETQKGFNAPNQSELEGWFDEPLPRFGSNSLALLDEVKTKVFDASTGNMGPNMYAYVMSGGNQMSTIAELLMSTINQNNAKWHLAPAMAEIEKRVVKWTAEMIDW
jgi:aromatic-L-amino-acid/L-tryptophan decarboxylase